MENQFTISRNRKLEFKSNTMGKSEEGRPIHVIYVGRDTAPLRVLVMAGQHGDEGQALMAVEQYSQTFSRKAMDSPQVSLAIVPNLNPDGAAKHKRKNARDIDLNRDHQLLASAETRALHSFVRTRRPHLIVDVHTYPPRRKRLLVHNLVYCHDVFIDVPTNPSLCHPVLGNERRRFLQGIIAELNARGYRSERYIRVTASGRVRHSTTAIVDARNGLTLRYGIPTILVEGREPVWGDSVDGRTHLLSAMQAALDMIVRWAEKNQDLLTVSRPAPRTNEWVAVRFRYTHAVSCCTIALGNAQSGVIRQVELPGEFRPHVEVTKSVRLPSAYAIPRIHRALIEVLRRHDFLNRLAGRRKIESVERYWIGDVQHSKRPNQPPRKLSVRTIREHRSLEDYVLFPVTQEGGHALGVYLEPESRYGLHRFPEMNLRVKPQSSYPILRVLGNIA